MSINKDELEGHDRDAEEALAAAPPEPEPEPEPEQPHAGHTKTGKAAHDK